MNLSLKLGLCLFVLSPALGFAADLTGRMAAPVFSDSPVSTWGGFYAGTFLSGSRSQVESSSQGARLGVSRNGHGRGLLAGYNVQSGRYVFGLEGDLLQNYGKAKFASAGALVAHDAQALHTAHLRGRFGYDLGTFLPFVAGGIAYQDSSISVPIGADALGANRTGAGWTLGAGVDWKVPLPILGMATLRTEYLYDHLPSRDFRYDPAAAAIGVTSSAHQLRAALIYTPSLRGWRAPQVDTADWAGAYAGVLAGSGKDRVRTATTGSSTSLDADGGLGGLYAGRNFVFGHLVAGWEGATMLSSLKGDGVVPGTANVQRYRDYFSTDIRARAGYAFGRFLPFVAAGAAVGRSEQSDAATLSHRDKITTSAWTIGAGVDYMLMERVSARIEYLHQTSWKNTDVDLNGVPMSQSRSADSVRAGLAWHFH
jgi:outer membrane immunogenic protein